MASIERQKVQVLSEMAESIRMLTGLENWTQQTDSGCCMITSAAWGEGKTVPTACLGILSAQCHYKRVLIIDMNWHKPCLHNCFGLTPEWDLTHYFHETSISDFIRSSGSQNLDILTAPISSDNGENSSVENSRTAARILKQSRELYEFILVDTAAMFPTNRYMVDPVIIGNACDLVILVALTSVTPRQQIKRALLMLQSTGIKVAGVVVNHWKDQK